MKSQTQLAARLTITFIILFLSAQYVHAQISIYSDDFPSNVGTLIITQDDSTDSVEVDVGLPGENQVWSVQQNYPHALYRQFIVDACETDFSHNFPDANMITRYTGKLGNLIHSYYFDDTQGGIYLFQRKTENNILLQGIGFDSAKVNFNIFEIEYSGTMEIEPHFLQNNFPLQYNDNWESVSEFSIKVDSSLDGTEFSMLATVHDSIHNLVDGWGTIKLPSASIECLRIKSYNTMRENIYINGAQIRSKTTRTINYNWIAKEYGVVARVISHSNQQDDNFTFAKQVSRLHLFNPQIKITIPDTSAAPEDILDIPIYVSDMTDLNIRKIKISISCDTSVIKPTHAIKSNTLSADWHDPLCCFSDSTFNVELAGEMPLSDEGLLFILRVVVLPTTSDTTHICFANVEVEERGPVIDMQSGKVIINVATDIANTDYENTNLLHNFKLWANYPNPFNATTTITFQLGTASQVNLNIYNSTGQLVSSLLDQRIDRGRHSISWNGRDRENNPLPSGLYFYRLRVAAEKAPSQSFDVNRKMILLR